MPTSRMPEGERSGKEKSLRPRGARCGADTADDAVEGEGDRRVREKDIGMGTG